MRLLLGLVFVAALGWSAYWWIGARGVTESTQAWLDARADAGWVANYSNVETRGFPNRFDATLTNLELADPATGLAWTAPFLQLFRLSYQRNHIIAVFAETQTLASPHQRIDIASSRAQASLIFRPGDALHLDRSNFVFDDLRLTSNGGWSARIDQMRLASRPEGTAGNSVKLGVDIAGFVPQSDTLTKLRDVGLWPGDFTTMTLDATLGFDMPWDRTALETRRPALTEMDLTMLKLQWGNLDLWAAGQVTVDPDGRMTGDITIKAKNWRQMLELAKTTGWIPEGLAASLETGLTLLAGLAGANDTLDAPLTLREGIVSFGPIRLGQAPRLKLR